jgi:hypothetical protein
MHSFEQIWTTVKKSLGGELLDISRYAEGRAERSVSLRLRQEVQEMLRRGRGELNVCSEDAAGNAPTPKCNN